MVDNGDLCTRENVERVGWDKDQRYSVKGNGDSWIAGKIKDDIEEFGYGGAFVRKESDQELAIVDVQRTVIARRGNAPTILVNGPVGDSQSNGRVENAIKKVRNVVKRWGVRVARYPGMFEWIVDSMAR